MFVEVTPWTFRRAVVTGGAGFIGSHIVAALVRQGTDVVVLDDLSSGLADNVPPGVELLRVDVANSTTARVIERLRPDLVIHAAAQVSVPASVTDPDRDREVNLVGTQYVVDGARAASASRIVFISSGGAIYGEAKEATEATLPAPMSPYGIHKLAAEGYVRLSGLPYAIVRYSNVYGPRQRPGLEGGVVATFLAACREQAKVTIFGGGGQVRDFLFVEDAVDGALAVAAGRGSGTWNVATGRRTSVLELLAQVEALVGRRCVVEHDAARPGDVASSSLSIDRIREEHGWQPGHTLDSGLQRTLASLS